MWLVWRFSSLDSSIVDEIFQEWKNVHWIYGHVQMVDVLKENFFVIHDMIVPMEVTKGISVIIMSVVRINFVVERVNAFSNHRLENLFIWNF